MRLSRVLSQAREGLLRNLVMTIAGALTVTVALLLLGVALVVHQGASTVKANLVNQLNISVYLQPNATPQESQAVLKALDALPQVEQPVTYIDKDHAYQLFRTYAAGDEALLKVTPRSAIPTSYVVKLTNPQDFDVVPSAVGDLQGVQSVTDANTTFARIFTFLHGLTLGAFAFAAFMVVIAALLIYNTMQISAFSRRREIGIMRLVGASGMSIQLPFVLEGTVIGLIGAVIAAGLLSLVRLWVTGNVALGVFAPFGSLSAWLGVLPVVAVVGIGLSAVLSFVTVQPRLRV
jgi:cell division transport system permease protein